MNRQNIVCGAMLIAGSIGEMAATRSLCPLCIGGFSSGSTLIASGLGFRFI